MDNGKSLLDVIDDTSEFFGSQNDSSGMFNWADEFLGDNEMDLSGGVAMESGNLATNTPSNILLTSSHYAATSSISAPTVTVATPFLQTSSLPAPEQQPTVMPALIGQTLVNPLQSISGQSGLNNQVLHQGNQQYILKTASGNQIQLTQNQLQQHLLQQQTSAQTTSSSSSANIMNRSVTPNSASGGIPTVSFGLNPSQFKSSSPGPNVNIVHLPGNLQTPPQQQQMAQQQQPQQTHQFQIAPGTFLQIPTGGAQNLANTGIVQGQQTILTGQQGALMNSQNTVIQNPNVVNVNVATHQAVLCNNPTQQQQQLPQQQQTRLTTQNPFNIQGTLIQTAEGKSILIPSQNLAQPINIQQLSMAQPVGQAQTQNPVGNMIQLAQSQPPSGSSETSQNQGLPQLVLNNQGQQILVQRASTPGGQPQNIIVRTTTGQPGLVQIQQRSGQLQNSGQTLQAIPNTGSSPQLKIVHQPTQNQSGVPMINIGGQNISLQQISGQLGNLQGLQVVQQTNQQQGQGQIPQGQITLQQISNSQGQVTLQPQAVLNSASSQVLQQSRSTPPGHSSQGQLLLHRGQVAVQQNVSRTSMQSLGNVSMQQKNSVSPQVQLSNQTNQVLPIQTSQTSTENARNAQAQILLKQIQQSLKKTQSGDTTFSQEVSSSQTPPNVSLMVVKQEVKQEKPCKIQFPSNSMSVVNPINLPFQTSAVKQEPFQTTGVKQEPDLIESLVKQEQPCSVATTAEFSNVTSSVSQSTPMSLFMISQSEPVRSRSNLQVSSPSFVDSTNVAINNSSNDLSNSAGASSTVGQVRPATVQTIHLPPELQHQFQRVQHEMRKVHAATELAPEVKQTKLKQLQEFQKKILLKGRVLATTRAQPHHIKQGLAALSQTGFGSNSVGITQTSSTELSSSGSNQQSSIGIGDVSSQVSSSTTVKDLLKSMTSANGSMTSLSNTQPQLPSNTTNLGPRGLQFMNSSTTSSEALSALLATSTTSLVTPTVTPANHTSSTSMPSNVTHVQQAPPPSQTEFTGSQSGGLGSGENVATPDVPVPTQIKIANKVLTLSLTRAQRDKVQSYLDKMTPEQQQQYLQTQQGVLQRIQKQQEMNAQVKAQLLAQKKQQALQANQNQVGGVTSETTQKVADQSIIKTEVKTIPIPNTSIQINKQTPDSGTSRNLLRGQKRNYLDIPKATLINQQIKQDQNHASNPDTKRPFKSRGDACRRLLRYHVFQSYGPSKEEFAKFDGIMTDIATDLMQKKDKMLDRFRVLLLHETMRSEPSSELVMLQRMQNQDLRKVIEEEKELVKTDPESFVPMPSKFLKTEAVEDESSGTEEMDTTLVKSETTDSETDETKKVKMKKLVIKTDGDNYRSSFKRQSLDGSGSSLEGQELLNVSGDSVTVDTVLEHSRSITNDDDEDTDEFDEDRYRSMQDEAEQAALLISSAEESQDSQAEEVSDTYSDLHSRNSSHLSSTLHKNATFSRNNSNCEMTSESVYFDESQPLTINTSRQSIGSISSLSRFSSVEESVKYVPSHSPVSNASSDNEVVMPESLDRGKMDNFDKFNMYQPITESLTDSEENSHYSADNSAEPNSIIIDDDECHVTKGNWKQPSHSKNTDQDVSSDQESDQEVKAQMESAINSILSLGQSSNPQSIYSYNQSSDILSNANPQTFEYSSTGGGFHVNVNEMSRSTVQGLSELNPYVIESDGNSDLDMAVNSILM